jgi:hypothetical protein
MLSDSERGAAFARDNAPHERRLYAATSENSPAPDDQRLKQEAQRYYQQQHSRICNVKNCCANIASGPTTPGDAATTAAHGTTPSGHTETATTPGTKTSGDAAATTVTGNAPTAATTELMGSHQRLTEVRRPDDRQFLFTMNLRAKRGSVGVFRYGETRINRAFLDW